jgi:hypothetical protein
VTADATLPSSPELAPRVRALLDGRAGLTERELPTGGVEWTVNGNLACGTRGADLLVALDGNDAYQALDDPHVRPVPFPSPTMRTVIAVDAEAIASAAQLARWVDAGAAYAASLPPRGVAF